MSSNEYYKFDNAYKDNTIFIFESIGKKGTFKKAIIYQDFNIEEECGITLTKKYKNLALVNINENEAGEMIFDDEGLTNNGDEIKIFRTVFNTIIEFHKHYPDTNVFISGKEKRIRVYNGIFKKYYAYTKYDIYALVSKDNLEIYNPNKDYIAFLIEKR